MRKLFSRCLLLLAVAAGAQAPAQAPLYENFGLVTSAPQVDATVFVNRGRFDLSLAEPFETQNTRFFTNLGSMTADPGFRFEFISATGQRRPADQIVNRGEIVGSSSGIPNPNITPILKGSHVRLNASNIISTGLLAVDSEGLLDIRGQNVNLSRSGLRATIPAAAQGQMDRGFLFQFDDGIFYTNPSGVSEFFVGTGVNGAHTSDGTDPQGGPVIPLNLTTLNLPTPRSPLHQVLFGGRSNLISIPLTLGFYNAWVFTNQISATNFLVQAVFVKTNTVDTNLVSDVRFAENPDSLLPQARTAIVEVGLTDVDAVTGDLVTNRVYILDTLATTTNAILYTNLFNTNIFRPSTLEVVRGFLPEWQTAGRSNAVFDPALFTAGFEGNLVTNLYASFGFLIGNAPAQGGGGGGGGGGGLGGGGGIQFFGLGSEEAALIFGGRLDPRLTDITNQPGQVQITADRLDLQLTRLKADGVVTLNSADFAGRDPRRLDAPAFRLNLQKKDGTMVVSNVVPPQVRRLDGYFYAYSAKWTNYSTGTDAEGNTNTVEHLFHTLIVDRAVDTLRPVESLEVTLRATNVVLGDDLLVTRNLRVDAVGFQNSGLLDNATGRGLDASNFPRLRHFTNAGILFTEEGMTLGADVPGGWATLRNLGMLQADSVRLRAATVENLGSIESFQGALILEGGDVKFDGQPDNPDMLRATVQSPNDVIIRAVDFKARNTDLAAGEVVLDPITGAINYALGKLILDIQTRLDDGGPDADNAWAAVDGVALLRKPPLGDLLGTTLTLEGPRFGYVQSLWNAEDRGPVPAGFANNAALGRLVLNGELFTLFSFNGSTPGRALYVEFLELQGAATNAVEALEIPAGFTLYFADSNLPAEELDGLLDGRLRWVRDFAGTRSGVDVALASGARVKMNRALVNSRTIDSDGDGVPNALDPAPLDPAVLRVKMSVRQTASEADITWFASPGGSYRVEFTTDLAGDVWTPLQTVTHADSVPKDLVVRDAVASGAPSRFYRVVKLR